MRPKTLRNLLAATGVGLAALAGFGANAFSSAPDVAHVDGGSEPLRIVWAGDTLLGDAAQPRLAAEGYDWPLEKVAHLLADSVAILNLEGPITYRSLPADPTQEWSYNAEPPAAAALKRAGADVVSLANNHSTDRGHEGLLDTIDFARAAGLTSFGGGRNRAEAERPLVISSGKTRIAVIGFTEETHTGRAAEADAPGVANLTPHAIERGIKAGRRTGADLVIAYVHWGDNYDAVEASQRSWARLFAEAGYDMVIGHGTHVAQRIESMRGMPVAYSLGNFAFTTPGRFTRNSPGFGMALATTFRNGRLATLEVTCIRTDNEIVDFRPRVCTPMEAERMFASVHPPTQSRSPVVRLRPADLEY